MAPPIPSVIVGTAGHIDHGKTALVRALTGTDADRLPEEKRRGITIDLGFAALDVVSSAGAPLRLSFVDVPGHSLFIHNMLAGAGCIRAVMLVVSAEESVKPQTVEHLAICQLLGVRMGLTVISKVDAVDPSRAIQVEAEVREFLHGTFLGDGHAPILSVSAMTGQGIPVLRQALTKLAGTVPESDHDHVPRLPVDRAFVMKGFGTVVTGSLLSGSLHPGQTLALEPGGRTVRVRGIQNHGKAEDQVAAGSRVALNLSGVEVSEVHRGQMLVCPKTLAAVPLVDVDAWLLPGAAPLKHGAPVHFHAFTSSTVAKVLLYGPGRLEVGAHRLLRLKLENPMVLIPGDPFVLRQVSPPATIGGGRVLDAAPLARQRKSKTMDWLQALQTANPEQQVQLRVARRGLPALSLHDLIVETGLERQTLNRRMQSLLSGEQLFQIPGEILLDRNALDSATRKILGVLPQYVSGIKRSELRSRTSLRSETLDFALHRLAAAGKLVLHGELVRTAEAPASAPDSALTAIATVYQRAGLSAPLTSEVVGQLKLKEVELRRIITLLLRQKILVQMGNADLFVHEDALARLRATISELQGQPLDVGRFKQITGLSRKYAIPLLEYLDRQRITRKTGDQRVVV